MKKAHSLLGNIHYVTCIGTRYSKMTPVFLVMNVLGSLVAPFCLTLIGTLTVYAVTNESVSGSNPWKVVLLIGMMCLIAFLAQVISIIGSGKYEWYMTFARCSTAWNRMSEKTMSVDYPIIETKETRKEMSKGFESLNSNWVGVEGLSKQTPKLLIGIVGMIGYGVLVAFFARWS